MRKPASGICKNKCANQLCSNHAADQHLCFRYIDHIDSTIPLLSKSENPKFQVSNHILRLYRPVCVRPGLKPQRQVLMIQIVFSLYKQCTH